jgi:hypothetical protein
MQTLRSENLKAAKAIYEVLKTEKCISDKRFKEIFHKSRGVNARYFYHFKNYESTIQFLKDHGLMTSPKSEDSNGFRIYVATQKCVRTKSFENATIVFQEVSDKQLDEAIKYVKISQPYGKVEDIAKVVTYNILKLTGNVAKEYNKLFYITYNYIMEDIERWGNSPRVPDIKFAVLVPARDIYAIKKTY